MNAPELPAYPEQPELAVAALLYMLSRYPGVRCPAMARAIAAHLTAWRRMRACRRCSVPPRNDCCRNGRGSAPWTRRLPDCATERLGNEQGRPRAALFVAAVRGYYSASACSFR